LQRGSPFWIVAIVDGVTSGPSEAHPWPVLPPSASPQRRSNDSAAPWQPMQLEPEKALTTVESPPRVLILAPLPETVRVKNSQSRLWAAKPAPRFDPSACEVTPAAVNPHQT